MAIDDLSDEEKQLLLQMYNSTGDAQMESLAFYAEWGPEEVDDMIFAMKCVRVFLEDLQECASNDKTKGMYEQDIKRVDSLLSILRKYRDNAESTIFY